MKAATSTFILITANRIARADFNGGLLSAKTAPSPAGVSTGEIMRAALALGGKVAKETRVLSTEVWAQEVKLNPAQVAGLTLEQLGRALSFEAEPFSGIPVAESATGFRDEGGGTFNVVQMPRTELDAVARATAAAGGQLAGVHHCSNPPESDETLLEWWKLQPARIAETPVLTPRAPEPSPHRFLIAGIALEALAIVFLLLAFGWNAVQRKSFESRNAEFTTAARELDAANKQNDALRKELAALEKQDRQRAQVHTRRGALLALLNTLAASRPDDVVVRSLAAEGPSSVIVSGLSLESGAVDDMSIALTQQLRAAGWTVQPRSKNGKKNLPNGGPWEFTLLLTHEEAVRAQAVQLSQQNSK